MIKGDFLFTVIVPVYNVAEYLKVCLDSIVNQFSKDFEILIINDGSTDGSDLICNEYKERYSNIRLINQANKGIAVVRNLAISEAKGEFIVFVDSDDYMAADYLFNAHKIIVNYPNLDIIINQYSTFDSNQGILNLNETIGLLSNLDLHKFMLSRKYSCAPWQNIYARRVFKQVIYPHGAEMEDAYILPDLLPHLNMGFVSNVLNYYYRQRSGSVMSSINDKKYRDLFQGTIRILYYVKNNFGVDRNFLQKYVDYYFNIVRGISNYGVKTFHNELIQFDELKPSLFAVLFSVKIFKRDKIKLIAIFLNIKVVVFLYRLRRMLIR